MNSTENNAQMPRSKWKLKISLIMFIAISVLASFKISIISIGDDRHGHIAIIWKDEGTNSLRLFDSDHAACQRKGLDDFFCEGRLAIVIQDRNLRLIGLPYNSIYANMVDGK